MENTIAETHDYDWLIKLAKDSGVTDLASLQRIVHNAKELGSDGVDLLLDSGIVQEDIFCRKLADESYLKWIDGELKCEDPNGLKVKLPAQLAVEFQVFPLSGTEDVIELVCYNPMRLDARQILSRQLEETILFRVASRRRVREGISGLYGVGAGTFEQILEGRDGEGLEKGDEATVIDEDLSDEASVLKFVNNIFREALAQKATDIHLEPQHNQLLIRYRVDGLLHDVPIPEHIHKLESAVIARLKIMAHFSVDVRVATIPCIEGETVSLRLLNQEKYDLAKLELEPGVEKQIEEVLTLSNGVILATGPTGSGKSTSLYSFLSKLNKPETRIVTIEDPVENKLPRVAQIAVKPEVGLTFAKGLRSILRADPNIVMVGEIRDVETAEIAIRASLTGHLVFSTLHTNSAIGAISRLVDMGIEPFLVSASVRGMLAQRLVRRLCEYCKKPVENWNEEIKEKLGIPKEFTEIPYEAVGCPECRHMGYQGRIALYEICVLSPKIQDLTQYHLSS